MARANSTVPKWNLDDKIWIYRPYIDGVQKKYTSRKPGPPGAAECKRKYNSALASEDKSRIRLAESWKKYLEDKADRLGKDSESYIKAAYVGKSFILPRLKNKRVCDITLQEWQECINKARGLKGKILAKKSLQNIRGEITAFGRYAKKATLIDQRITDLDIPKNAPVIGKNILQPDTLADFLAADDDWYIHLWQFMVVTGLRPGEAYGLKQKDIVNGMIRIRRSIDRRGRVTPGKNKNAVRTMVQTQIATKILLAQSEMLCRAGIKSDWVFPDEDGLRLVPSTVRHRWDAYVAKLPFHITQYGLRHTFNSIGQELPDAYRKKLFGHSKSMDTDKVYGHIVDGEDTRIAAAVDAVLDAIISKTSTKQVLDDNQKP